MGQPPAPQQPPPAAPPVAAPAGQAPAPGKGLAITSMVLGIVALAFWCVPYLGIPCALIGLILGAVALNKIKQAGGAGKGMAVAGLVCSIITLAIMIILTIVAIVAWQQLSQNPEFQEMLRRSQEMQ